jgi:hypothetical protein
VVAGVGNIFRAEVLFETELDPRIPGKSLSEESFDLFWKLLTRLMRVGLRHGRIIAVTAREAGLPLAKVPDNRRLGFMAGRSALCVVKPSRPSKLQEGGYTSANHARLENVRLREQAATC